MNELRRYPLLEMMFTPPQHRFEMRWLKLRNAWERFAIHAKGQLSEHSWLPLPGLRAPGEFEELLVFGQDAIQKNPSLDRLRPQVDFMTKAIRVTIPYRGYVIRVQSSLDLMAGHLCSLRINLRGKSTFGLTLLPNLDVLKLPAHILEAAFSLLPSSPPNPKARESAEKFEASIRNVRFAEVCDVKPHPTMVQRVWLRSSSNVRELAQSRVFASTIDGLDSWFQLQAYGSLGGEANLGNFIGMDFLSQSDAVQLGKAISIVKALLDELEQLDLIEPVLGPDLVVD